MGIWGFWMPGFMHFLTGVYLLMIWFDVFGNVAPLYTAGLAFTAYGIHWFAMAHRRYDVSAQPDGWMAIAFLFISILGVDVFRRAGDIPVMIIFVGLTLIYAIEIRTRLLWWRPGGRLVGLLQFVTGIWLPSLWTSHSAPKPGYGSGKLCYGCRTAIPSLESAQAWLSRSP